MKEIDRALTAADVVLVLWSANSIDSAWVRDEAEAGPDTGRLVPATLDDSRPPLGFRQYQAIDLARWKETEDLSDLDELLDALGTAVSRPSDAVKIRQSSHTGKASAASRRKVLIGGGAAVAAALGGGAYLYRRAHPPLPPEVEDLIARAKVFQEQNSTDGQYQAIGLLERVVKLVPEYADGWGRLGVAYAVPSHYRERTEALQLRAKAEAAGRRALDLDPDSVYGEMALAVALPFVGHWLERDRRTLSALDIAPRNDDLLILRGVVLQFDGRPGEAVGFYKRVRHRPFTPAV